MKRTLELLGGVGLGAGLMYFLDSVSGRRRRALVRDQMVSALSRSDDVVTCVARDLSHQVQGLFAETCSLFTGGKVSDRQLVARVRSKLGRVVAHPSAIDVAAQGGRVTLSGPILAHEVPGLLRCVEGVPGVAGVENRLEVHEQAGRVSALQGGRPRTGELPDVLQEHWSPGTRALVGLAGATLLAAGFRRGFPTGCVLGTVGLALGARSATNKSLGRLLGACAQAGAPRPETAGCRETAGAAGKAEPAGVPVM
jgi:hypothetical protein